MLKAEPRRRARRAASPARDDLLPPAPSVDLFAPGPAGDPEAADHDALARAATLASGRAMQARRWSEAKALAALAESYAQQGRQARGRAQTVETLDLGLIVAVLLDENGVVPGGCGSSRIGSTIRTGR